MAGHRLDQRGFVLSSPLAVVSAAAVVLAGIAFAVTGSDEKPDPVARQVTAVTHAKPHETHAAAPATKAPRPVIKKKPKPSVRRGDVYVEVYNNSGISGLAGRTSQRASGAGWNVVGSDNWYGTIPASTVYYPERLHTAAKLLARDLGIERLRPSIAPMRFDRLTVILTGDSTH
ncbi:MAG: LytR C-terminal domain-containing protein [Nocardioidaceae bacterium]